MKVRVKICGITSTKDLFTAVEAGADAVGFVVNVPQSPRNLSLNKAKEIVKSTPIFVETVIVTVTNDINQLVKIQKELNPSSIQIHGLKEYHEIRRSLSDTHLIGAIQADSQALKNAMEVADTLDAVLLDSYVPGKYGGTGITHDWELSKRIREAIHPKPLIMAGGLKPENVKEAIQLVKPYAVDVSSGVESQPGIKDPKKVSEFIKNAKEVEIQWN